MLWRIIGRASAILLLELAIEVRIVAAAEIAHRQALLDAGRPPAFERRLDLADGKIEERLRHRLHRVGEPVGGGRIGQLRRELDRRRRRSCASAGAAQSDSGMKAKPARITNPFEPSA